jgi:hypothetical protein
MAEANTLSKYEASLRASMIGGVITIAHSRARDAVKRELQGRGLKVSHFSAKQISILAEEYFAQHGAELLPEAITTVERMRAQGHLGKRAQRVFVQNLQLTHRAPRPEPQAQVLCETHAHGGV